MKFCVPMMQFQFAWGVGKMYRMKLNRAKCEAAQVNGNERMQFSHGAVVLHSDLLRLHDERQRRSQRGGAKPHCRLQGHHGLHGRILETHE